MNRSTSRSRRSVAPTTDLTGHAFVIAALPWGDGTNIVNGDGMIYRLDFGDAEVPLKARLANGSTGDESWIFDASNLAQGPLCRLAHPELDLGFTLHTTWMESISRRTATYLVPARTDYAASLANQSQEIRDLFERDVFPHLA